MKVIFFTTLLLFSINGFAVNWKKIDTNVNGKSFYIDVDSLKKHNGFVYHWQLVNYLKPPDAEVHREGHSFLVKWKVDCGEETRTDLILTEFDQLNGTGKVLNEWKTNETFYERPNTVGYVLMKFACDNAK